jgi:hypothetical protein
MTWTPKTAEEIRIHALRIVSDECLRRSNAALAHQPGESDADMVRRNSQWSTLVELRQWIEDEICGKHVPAPGKETTP